jgi:hypothetical protein
MVLKKLVVFGQVSPVFVILLNGFLFYYSVVVFCTVNNVCIKLIFLAVFALVMMIVILVAALLVGLAFCIALLFFCYC